MKPLPRYFTYDRKFCSWFQVDAPDKPVRLFDATSWPVNELPPLADIKPVELTAPRRHMKVIELTAEEVEKIRQDAWERKQQNG